MHSTRTREKHSYPEIGKKLPCAAVPHKLWFAARHKLILWSVREGKLLDEAVNWCKERGIEFYAVNRDYPEERGTDNNNHFSRKLKVDMFIDDRNIGGLPDWGTIYRMIKEHKTYYDIMMERMGKASYDDAPKKKRWWQR